MEHSARVRRNYYEKCPSCYGLGGDEGRCYLCDDEMEVTSYAAELYRRWYYDLAEAAARSHQLDGPLPPKRECTGPPGTLEQINEATLRVLTPFVEDVFKTDPLLAYLRRRG